MRKYFSLVAILSLVFFACKEDKPVKEMEIVEKVVETVIEKEGIKLSTNSLASEFANASLNLIAPSEGDTFNMDSTLFRFGVENYQLGVNTADPLSGQCANSGKGQHIHFIMNNEPYSAHYNAEFKKPLNGNSNVMLAFLSRSYHMSLKTKDAYVLKDLMVGDGKDEFDETAPHMFYSRPKGEYVGDDAKSVMLDFYLVNTDLMKGGNTVRATINGVSFDLDSWEPYFIEGLVEGENTIALELLDANGELVPSPFNPVSRTIQVKYNTESI